MGETRFAGGSPAGPPEAAKPVLDRGSGEPVETLRFAVLPGEDSFGQAEFSDIIDVRPRYTGCVRSVGKFVGHRQVVPKNCILDAGEGLYLLLQTGIGEGVPQGLLLAGATIAGPRRRLTRRRLDLGASDRLTCRHSLSLVKIAIRSLAGLSGQNHRSEP